MSGGSHRAGLVVSKRKKSARFSNLEKRERKARLALPRLLAEDVAQALDGVGENERYQLPLHLRVWTLLDCLGYSNFCSAQPLNLKKLTNTHHNGLWMFHTVLHFSQNDVFESILLTCCRNFTTSSQSSNKS